MMRHIYLKFQCLGLFLIISFLLPIKITSNEKYLFREYQVGLIKDQIRSLKPLPEDQLNHIAQSILISSEANQIPYKLMTSIIMVESSFSQQAISTTGDISIVQINYKIWKKEAIRMNMELSEERLKTDSRYAIQKMGMILKYLKKTYSRNDQYWYARYHSRTPKLKQNYLTRLIAVNNKQSVTSNKDIF